MKKLIFFSAMSIAVYNIYIIADLLIFQFTSLNDYGNGFLFGKALLILVLLWVIIKSNPYKKQKLIS
ncbi:hypothetical protein [Chryseobacterium sp. RU37D]|uniref:hypothetical protein n=1 Tax=Chryseobacterium sp. RU37D TaxID=1907397 RepID=UPI00097094AB|nr:hypothetical protein [Chryseobacterium sp. RU37D]